MMKIIIPSVNPFQINCSSHPITVNDFHTATAPNSTTLNQTQPFQTELNLTKTNSSSPNQTLLVDSKAQAWVGLGYVLSMYCGCRQRCEVRGVKCLQSPGYCVDTLLAIHVVHTVLLTAHSSPSTTQTVTTAVLSHIHFWLLRHLIQKYLREVSKGSLLHREAFEGQGHQGRAGHIEENWADFCQ